MEDDYRSLKIGWQEGDRDRERSLSLMFLCWMHWAEPDSLTGLTDDSEATKLWLAVFDHFGGEASSDAEFLFVASLMADIFPWALGNDADWEARSKRLAARSLNLRPQGFSTKEFEGRGDYGDYFWIHAKPTWRDLPADH